MRYLTALSIMMLLVLSFAKAQYKDDTETQKAEFSRAIIEKYKQKLATPVNGRVDKTMAIMEVYQNFSKMTVEAQEEFKKLAASDEPTPDKWYTSPSKKFRIGYCLATNTTHALYDYTDADGDGYPDYINAVGKALDSIWNLYFTQLGFNQVPMKSSTYKVIIMDEDMGVYGYCRPDQWVGDNPNSDISEKNAYTSVLTLSANYKYLPGNKLDNMRITSAHEFQHGVQFGYDYTMNTNTMESFAVWAETVAYPGIAQYTDYIALLTNSDVPVDYNEHLETISTDYNMRWYSAWYFPRHIYEKYGVSVIKDIYSYYVTSGDPVTIASCYNAVLGTYGSTFSKEVRNMWIGIVMMNCNKSDETYGYQRAAFIKANIDRNLVYEDSYANTKQAWTFDSETSSTSDKILYRHAADCFSIRADYDYDLKIKQKSQFDAVDYVMVMFDQSGTPNTVRVVTPTVDADGYSVFSHKRSDNEAFGVLIVTNMNDGINSQSVQYAFTLTPGDVNPTGAVISVSPQSLSFDNMAIGKSSSKEISVTNTGNTNLTISKIEVTDGDNANFTVTPALTGNLILQANESQTFTVTFLTSDASHSPEYSANVSITSDATNAASYTVSLSATVDMALIKTNAANNTVDYGIVDPRVESSQTVTIQNTGTQPLTITSISFADGQDPKKYFTLPTVTFPLVIQPSTPYQYAIKFKNPNIDEDYSAVLHILSNALNTSDLALTLKAKTMASDVKEGTTSDGLFEMTAYPTQISANSTVNMTLNGTNPEFVSVEVYDISGRKAVELYNGLMNPGSSNAILNASALPSGKYFIIASTGNQKALLSVVVTK